MLASIYTSQSKKIMLHIIPYTPEHQPHFERLNRAWIEQHFWMEPVDEAVLTQPEEHILAPGGKIFMALWDGEIAGTVALKKMRRGRVEMTKMAVYPQYRGNKIGEALILACVEEAKVMGMRRLILYSNTVLANAIHLYRKMGFTETLPREDTYERSDIKMEMPLCAFDAEDRTELLDTYARVPEDVRKALMNFPRNMWLWHESPSRWSIHEIILHLCDSEANSYLRARRMIAEPGSLISAYDENRWAKELAYESQNTEDALELFTLLRKNTHGLLQYIPESAWQRHAIHTENGKMTLDDWLWSYANHNHIGQMKRLFAKWEKQKENF